MGSVSLHFSGIYKVEADGRRFTDDRKKLKKALPDKSPISGVFQRARERELAKGKDAIGTLMFLHQGAMYVVNGYDYLLLGSIRRLFAKGNVRGKALEEKLQKEVYPEFVRQAEPMSAPDLFPAHLPIWEK